MVLEKISNFVLRLDEETGSAGEHIHPRDLDAGQPMLEGLPMARKFKSYVGLRGAEKKLRRWLTEFSFMDIATAADNIDWSVAPVVSI